MNLGRPRIPRISIDGALLATVSILGIYDGIRVLKLPVFVSEPLGSGFYLIGVSTLLLLATGAEALLHPATRRSAHRARSRKPLSLLRDREIQAWLALVAYILLLEAIGYFLSTLCYLIVSIRLFGERRWVRVIVTGSALAIAFFLLFERLAGIPLP